MTHTSGRVLIMGVGNPLMLDDGAGPAVIAALESAFEFPDNVDTMDAGTMGFSILDVFRDLDHLIVVDAIKGVDYEPGTVVLLTPEDMAQSEIIRSAHDTQLIEVLKAAAMLGHMPETICVGVQIQAIREWVLELSQPVSEAIPVAAGAVIGHLLSLGIEAAARPDSVEAATILEIAATHEPRLPADGAAD